MALTGGWPKQGLEVEELMFPKFDYYLDESDPDIVILRRQDGSFVAAFSASGATKKSSSKPPGRIIGRSSRLTPTRLLRRFRSA